ncbi:MAG: DUF116 domain-containing protein [Thermoplasmata archaeon]|nr:DUF116 domain-containing protein [Thermoplasmata archaeon]
MTINLPLLIKSYVIVGRWSNIPLRLLIVLIGILLGLTSLSILYSFQVLEGIVLFVFFFISCYLIDSYFNINARKAQQISSAINIFRRSGFFGIVAFHIIITILLAFHLSFILDRLQIVLLTCAGLGIVTFGAINSALQLKRSLSATTPNKTNEFSANSNIPLITSSIGMVLMPMTSAYFITNEALNIFSILTIIGITVVFGGITVFEQLNEQLQSNVNGDKTKNSVDWEAVQVTKELGLCEDNIKNVAVDLYNLRNEPEFSKIPNNERLLFLPHCLRVANKCKGKYGDEGMICQHCTKDCRVNIITTEAQKLGYKCFVVPGGAMVFNIANKYKPKAVLAVACFNELKEGAARTSGDYDVPFQLVPLLKDGCVNTEVNVEEVKQLLRLGHQGTSTNTS